MFIVELIVEHDVDAEMDRNTGWHHNYDQNQNQNHPQQDTNTSRAAAASVHDAQALLAVYPMASVTPTSHGEIALYVYLQILLTGV